MGEIEFLTKIRKLTFKIIMYIFLSSESERVVDDLEKEYTHLNHGIRAMAINIPGFVYHRARKARVNLVTTLQSVLDERRRKRRVEGKNYGRTKVMMNGLMEVEDESGRKLRDEEIIDILIMYLNAGHESSAHIVMWSVVLLQQHPEFLEKARKEQEEISKRIPPTQEGLTLKEYRQMEYLSNVTDETLHLISFSLMAFREARQDVEINGYIILKGWKVLLWFRSIHLDPEIYPDPKRFDPSRWKDFKPRPGTFLPFGRGGRFCPGNDLAKLEIAIFLHYFLLNYRLERVDPKAPTLYLPHTRPKDNCLARIRKLSSPSTA
ncbi:hypothetical protein MLD38_033727 [Melastoma candidum]|uniref:Uncharacterized protein n=1 Tax=Melastoma candidum TaxID=119954 RepID=A0ACB9M9S3_9MYRT|nr:hypothetical protein MLD38_033727 [Melastoma candidum]